MHEKSTKISYFMIFIQFVSLTLGIEVNALNISKPTGPNNIGTRFYYFIDESRSNQNFSDSTQHREISVQMWYPAKPRENSTYTNFNHKETAEFWVKSGLFVPSFIEEVALRPSNSIFNSDVKETNLPYPIVLYSASGVLDANIILAEELASNGFVVIAVGHPHWCAYYFDEKGNVIFRNKERDLYNQQLWAEENSEIVKETKKQLTLAKTVEEKLKYQMQLNENMPLEINDIKLWVEDYKFIMNKLQQINNPNIIFNEIFDFQNVGLIGYSKGGAAVGQACHTEDWVMAGVNLSGFMFGDITKVDLGVPFMIMESVETWCNDCPPINDLLYHTTTNDIYFVQVSGSTHGNFCDISLFRNYLTSDFKSIIGPIDGQKFMQIQNDYVLQFFNKYLKSLKAPILEESNSSYPEVIFKSKLK